MRSLKLSVGIVLAAWLASSFAQQDPPPPATPPATRPAPPAAPAPPPRPEQEEPDSAPAEDAEDVFVPTEELQPDAAVTFPVDI